ncbi:MAG: 4Fe-4S binding protein, partial [Acidimicrobiia bacterium]
MSVAVLACTDRPALLPDDSDAIGIAALCEFPEQLAHRIDDAERVVLLLHESRYGLAEVQKVLRSVDIDPLGVEILEIPTDTEEFDVGRALAGLRARAAAFTGSQPEHAKPVLRGEVTRRGLFQPPQPVYLAAPLVDHGVCAAADGCRACATACPQDAYRWHQGRIHFNKDMCEPCGRCVAACPTEAISNPVVAPNMIAAQTAALVSDNETSVGLRFVCSRARQVPQQPGWQGISVPCTGMVPGSWLITAVLMGASAVTIATCSTTGCELGHDEQGAAAIDFARSALEAAGLDPSPVPITPGDDQLQPPIAKLEFDAPFTRHGDVEVMLALNAQSEGELDFAHAASSLGVVSINAEACTLCAQCAQTCPTGAITADYEGETVALSFAAASCTNCNQCTIACPEIERDAIRVDGRVAAALLTSERFTITEGAVLV